MSDLQNRFHEHKWFLWQTKTPFEPITIDGKTYWHQVEYVYMFCNCGDSFKEKLKSKDES